MIKNILLIVMTIFSLMSFAFGFIQKLEADKQRELAVVAMEKAVQQQAEAEKMRLTAQYQEMQAKKQLESTLEALGRCEESKKK